MAQKGLTLIELVMVLVIAGILASAFVALMIPQMNLFFFLPQRMRVQNTASDLLDVMIEGDNQARGLRYAGPTSAAVAIPSASAASLTYNYVDSDLTAHNVILTYQSASHTVTRQMDGGAAQTVPYYATASAGILINPAETNFFRYYTSAGAEMTGGGIVPANIYRVDIAVTARSGSGKVTESEGNILMKSGTEIKHYATEVPDI